jgi:hypothetical protein
MLAEQRVPSLTTAVLTALSVWLYFFVLFKLLSFFMITVNLLVCFLLIGHPMGVVVASRFYRADWTRAFRHYAVVLLLTLLALSLLQLLHPNYLAIWGFETRAFWISIAFLVACGLLCLPYFVYAGVVEYAVLETARLQGRPLSLVYGLLLGATLVGLIVGHLLLPVLGSLGILVLAIALALAGAAPRRRTLVLALGGGLALLALVQPSIEQRFIHLVQPKEPGRTGELLTQSDASSVHAAWGKHSYVEMIRMRDVTFGSYNGLPYWDVTRSANRSDPNFQPDVLLMELLPEGGRLGIIGAGGGRQVQTALAANRKLAVDGFEIEPEVGRFFWDVDPQANGGVYSSPGVELHIGDGRALVRSSEHSYDAIYLADPGNFFSHFRTMLMATHFLHTREAYADYLSRLEDDGLLAALIMRPVDDGISQRIVNVMHDLGLETVTVESELFRMTIGTRPAHADALAARVATLAPTYGLNFAPMEPDLSIGNPIPTDDRGGSYIFSLHSPAALQRAFVWTLVIAALVFFAGGAVGARVTRTPLATILIAGGLGVSFAVLQNAFILALARDLLELTDAVFIGSATFLSASVAGAVAARRLARRLPLLLLAGIAVTVALLMTTGNSPSTLLASVLVIAASGAMFPLLLDTSDETSLPTIFAADGLGAMLGTVVVFFTPVLYGITMLIYVALALTLLMGVAMYTRLRGGG